MDPYKIGAHVALRSHTKTAGVLGAIGRGALTGFKGLASNLRGARSAGQIAKGAWKSELGKDVLISGGLNSALSGAMAQDGDRAGAALRGLGIGAVGGVGGNVLKNSVRGWRGSAQGIRAVGQKGTKRTIKQHAAGIATAPILAEGIGDMAITTGLDAHLSKPEIPNVTNLPHTMPGPPRPPTQHVRYNTNVYEY